MEQRRVIKVAKVPVRQAKKQSALKTLATLCYYYPQYSLAEARRLPAPHVQLLLKTAKQIQAARYLNLVRIAAAPHTEKGKAVNELITEYQDIMDGKQ